MRVQQPPPSEEVDWEALSDRGKVILAKIATPYAQGFSLKEIAAHLGISRLRVEGMMQDLRDELHRLERRAKFREEVARARRA